MTTLTIIARRWFDKRAGNTYHSVQIYDGNNLIANKDFAYGYDDAYKLTAFKLLVEKGIYSGEQGAHGIYKEFRQFHFTKESGGDGHLFIVTDVARKKDLT